MSLLEFVHRQPMGGIFVIHPALNSGVVIWVTDVTQTEEIIRHLSLRGWRECRQFFLNILHAHAKQVAVGCPSGKGQECPKEGKRFRVQ